MFDDGNLKVIFTRPFQLLVNVTLSNSRKDKVKVPLLNFHGPISNTF